jgi:TetR/AcrR family transcriptional repressor of nem operon
MRYGAEHKETTRRRVLAEAAQELRAEGPHRISLAGVMARAGLTQGGFYGHFASKDDLLVQAIDQLFRESADRWRRMTEGKPPADALAAYLGFYLSPEHRDARDFGCALPFLASDSPRLSPRAAERFAAGVARLRAAIAGQFAALGRTDPDACASSMLSEMMGALSLARAERDQAASDAILASSKAALQRRFGLPA